MFSKRVAASPGDSLFAKALSCIISVVKADRVQDGAATSRNKCFCGYQRAFSANRFVTFLLDCKFWKNDTAMSVK